MVYPIYGSWAWGSAHGGDGWLKAMGFIDFAGSTVVHMCGSGVTACHNLLAMEVAGLYDSRLYVGSWSEWIRGAARPVATGWG